MTGEGTRVSLTLTLERAAEPVGNAEAAQPSGGPEKAAQTYRVLCAQENAINGLSLVKDLEHLGHAVSTAKDGVQALEALDKEQFDVVLMDVQMPKMDVLECTGLIRKGETHAAPDIPIIGLTGYAMAEERRKFLQAGMDAVVPKPIKLSELKREMIRVIGPSTG